MVPVDQSCPQMFCGLEFGPVQREVDMFDRRRWLALGMLALISMAVPSLTLAAKGANNKAGKVEGTLVGVATNGVVIKRLNGTQVSLGVTATTKVELNGRRVAITSLPIGSAAQALFDPATQVASKVEAVK